MKDFTFNAYKLLLTTLQEKNYSFQTVEEYFTAPLPKTVILRHDVDSWPANALQMAAIEVQAGVKATYYFRVSPLSFDSLIIRQIVGMSHEIGYHYEDLASCNGNQAKAIHSFERNLKLLRSYYPVKTIAMHGRPLSKWDNLDLWKKYEFKNFDIIGEPYLSLDFNKMLYLTDTGNCWDGDKYSIRDNVKTSFKFNIHTTFDLIYHLQQDILPEQIMLNIHPARWNDNPLKWLIRYYILTLPKYQTKKWVKAWRKK